jgi:hypothetical protein
MKNLNRRRIEVFARQSSLRSTGKVALKCGAPKERKFFARAPLAGARAQSPIWRLALRYWFEGVVGPKPS